MHVTEAHPFKLARTSWAAPAQWQGQSDAGEWVYLRMRHGLVQIGFASTIEAAIDETINGRGYSARISDDVDFEWEQMLPHYTAALLMNGLGAKYG